MKKLKFTIEDKKIAELLGRQNFSTRESAIFELLKNCYDSGSKTCDIYIESNCIKIIDSGDGMNQDDIESNWMHVGKSNKGYKNEQNNRVLAGSKGVGRFALARLGNSAKVISKKEKEIAVIWETDWLTSGVKETSVDFSKGTIIEISDLRDIWRWKNVETLITFISRAYKGGDMKIHVHFEGETYNIYPIFEGIKMGENYVSKITMRYDSGKMRLSVTIESDEFRSEVKEIIKPISERYYEDVFDMINEIKKDEVEEPEQYLKELGDFSAELYFYLGRIGIGKEKFMYKHNEINKLDTGVILYRNAFSISSLDGKKDWLDIASRARLSPAAATHRTGNWRVRQNQLFGFVMIDKNKNPMLKDLANRQGLEEDEYYQLFKNIIGFGLSRFERYRQSIIKKIDDKNKIKNKQKENNKNLKHFLNKPTTVTKMSEKELVSLVDEIKDIQREAKEQSQAREESTKQHKYDVRILNVLATQGLRASAIAHELHNKRNSLESGYKNIIEALEEYGFWEELNSDEFTRVAYKNVPQTLERLEEINIKLIAFLDVILNKIEKNKFSQKIKSIKNSLEKIVETWSQQYTWLNFKLNIKNDKIGEFRITNDVLEVIFDNLILNSIQHNELKDKLIIKISVEINGNTINVEYGDNGIGLSKKYVKEPKRILEVHETSRDDGHGLGMWIVNNTLHMYEGEVVEIDGNQGFNMNFNLKG
ncbi:sensor histidine kinase [Bacillus velezensis]|uniref:sensor histidine kinase n=1 Tax=Bacillus velezensis TaxID=492670 RepID=UPI002DBE1B0C|nr:sensor histidine kinase [Bacillus velezensis]MEC2240715.1 sensor histidine kinase [Bacillus velezensis]